MKLCLIIQNNFIEESEKAQHITIVLNRLLKNKSGFETIKLAIFTTQTRMALIFSHDDGKKLQQLLDHKNEKIIIQSNTASISQASAQNLNELEEAELEAIGDITFSYGLWKQTYQLWQVKTK
jgi:hypothetical protein